MDSHINPEQKPQGTYTFEDFIAFHGIQLYAVQFPRELEHRLYDKLMAQIFDIGNKVKIIVNEDEEKIEL